MKRISIFILTLIISVSVVYAGTTTPASDYTFHDGYDLTLQGSGVLTVGNGIVNVKQEFIAPAAKAETAVLSIALTTGTFVGSTTTATAFTIPAVCRNLVVKSTFTLFSGTATTTGYLVISGNDARGEAQTETINFSTATGTGVKAWSSITSLTAIVSAYTVGVSPTVQVAGIHIGTGDVLGLSNAISAYTDVYKIVETAVDVTPSASNISATYNTFTPADVPDGTSNYEVHYKAISR